jgi:hypothetical protein
VIGRRGSAGDDRGRVAWRAWVLPAVLVVLLLALVATATVLVRDRREAPLAQGGAVEPADIGPGASTSGPAAQAVVRARLAARTYFTVDHATVEADMDRFRELATPAFVQAYDRAAEPLVRRVVDQRLELSAALPRGGMATEYLGADVAQVLVAVDVTTRRGADSSTAEYRTRVLLQRVDDEWLVAGLDEVL